MWFAQAISPKFPHGRNVRVAGNVIVRQRPGTAKGITFVSLEDETGISNVVVKKEILRRSGQRFCCIHGSLPKAASRMWMVSSTFWRSALFRFQIRFS